MVRLLLISEDFPNPVLLFHTEVHSGIEVQVVHTVDYGEVVAAIVVELADEGCTAEICPVVPYNSCASDEVETQSTYAVEHLNSGDAFAADVLVADSRRQGYGEQEVACRHPVVGIAGVEGIAAVGEALEVQARVADIIWAQCFREFFIVEVDALSVKAKSKDEGSSTSLLDGALVVGRRVGEASVVEYVVGIGAEGVGTESREGITLKLRSLYAIETVYIAYRKVAGVAHKDEVTTYHVAVKTEVQFCLFCCAVGAAHVDGEAEENPAPAYVGSNLVGRAWCKVDGASVAIRSLCANSHDLQKVCVLCHDGPFVVVGLDVVVVVAVEAPYCVSDLFSYSFPALLKCRSFTLHEMCVHAKRAVNISDGERVKVQRVGLGT